MSKKIYDSYYKTWFYETTDGKRSLTQTVEEAAKAPVTPDSPLKEIKKKWWQFWK